MNSKGISLLITIIAITTVVITLGCDGRSTQSSKSSGSNEHPTVQPTTLEGKPSLIFSSFDVVKDPDTDLAAARVEVYNAGDATAKNFNVLVEWEYITYAPELKYYGSNSIVQSGYLVPGKRITYSNPSVFVIKYSGKYRVSAILVPDNRVPNKKTTVASKEVYLSS